VPDDWADADPGWASGVPQVPDDDWVVLDHPGSPGAEPALDSWPPPSPGSPDPEPPAGAEEPEETPATRVESTFDVWQAPGPAAEPDAGPVPAAPEPAERDLPARHHDLAPEPLRDADLLPADQGVAGRRMSRSSSPAAGWNPDSEEDWLRVLRGLRSSED